MDAPSAGYAFEYLIETLNDSSHKKFFNVPRLGGTKYDVLPYSIRVLLEAAVRNCDGFLMKKEDVMNILDWKTKQSNVEVPFFPARVLLQDFTGIPAMVDFAAMREAVKTLGGDPKKVHPACPTDLTVDHSLQIDFNKCAIQNAPNPGGGDLQKAGKLSPLRVQPKKLPCRGQATCRGSCDSGELGRNSGKFSSQIENTPILCPFHLQPVPEYEMFFKIFVSAKLFFSFPSPPNFIYIAFIFVVLPVVLKEAKIIKIVVSKYRNLSVSSEENFKNFLKIYLIL